MICLQHEPQTGNTVRYQWYQLLKRVGERIAKQCLTLTRLTHELDVLAAAVWSVGLLAILSTIYAFSPVAASGDSRWSLHTAMSLIRGHVWCTLSRSIFTCRPRRAT